MFYFIRLYFYKFNNFVFLTYLCFHASYLWRNLSCRKLIYFKHKIKSLKIHTLELCIIITSRLYLLFLFDVYSWPCLWSSGFHLKSQSELSDHFISLELFLKFLNLSILKFNYSLSFIQFLIVLWSFLSNNFYPFLGSVFSWIEFVENLVKTAQKQFQILNGFVVYFKQTLVFSYLLILFDFVLLFESIDQFRCLFNYRVQMPQLKSRIV